MVHQNLGPIRSQATCHLRLQIYEVEALSERLGVVSWRVCCLVEKLSASYNSGVWALEEGVLRRVLDVRELR